MDKHTDKYGNVTYGGEAREKQNVDDTMAAYGGGGDAAYGLINSLSPQATLAIFVVGVLGGSTLFFALKLLTSYGFNINVPVVGYIVFILVIVIACWLLFYKFGKRLMSRVNIAIFALMLVAYGVPHFTGNGTFTAPFKLQKAAAYAAEPGLRSAPSADAEVTHTLKQGDKLEVIGVTADGWMKVIVPNRYISLEKILTPNGITADGSGWISAEAVKTNNGKQPRRIQNAQVISNTLNVRYYPRILAARPVQVEDAKNGVFRYAANKGDIVQVTGPERGGYVPVFVAKGEDVYKGFALASSLAIEGADASDPRNAALTPPQGATATVVKDWNMRSSEYKSTRYIAKTIRAGEPLILLNPKPTANNWYHIWFDGEEGWIGTNAVKLD